MQTAPNPRRLPGDFAPRPGLDAALRVNHAGEYGAQRIYAGQLAILKDHAVAPELKHMAAQEEVHLATFNRLLPQYGVRPSALMPLWHIGGWLMGAATAAMGTRAAMACTVAVETVIAEHYAAQLADPAFADALRPTITQFRDEEMEHHAIGLAHDAEQATGYPLLSGAIQRICRSAIWLTARV
jgi:ubiquinone biosynthesis monooxygenase Coq7